MAYTARDQLLLWQIYLLLSVLKYLLVQSLYSVKMRLLGYKYNSKLPEQEFGGLVETTIGTYGSTIIKGTVTGGITDTTSFRLSAAAIKMMVTQLT